MSIDLPSSSASTFILPPPPAGTSPGMTCAIDRYASEFLLDNDEGAWTAAAQAVADQPPATMTDAAAKLLIIAHYMNPEIVDGQPAIDLGAFDCDTGRMLLQCAADLLALSEAAR